LARSGDVLIALSTSGASKSILNAIEKAKELKVFSVLMTSTKYSGDQGDHVLKVESIETEQIQHAHIAIGHIICELIEMNCAKSK
jgi:D-sedoheptulose 7-phosphate isomerase